MEGDVALAIDHHHAIEIHLAGARAPGSHRRKGRHDLERTRNRGGFVDEGKLLLVHGIGAHADAVGVEHHLAVAVSKTLIEILQRHQLFVFDRHLLSLRIPNRAFIDAPSPLAGEGHASANLELIWVRGSYSRDPHPAHASGLRHPLPQGERVKARLRNYTGVKNGSGAPSVALNTTFTFWPIFSFSMSQSTKFVSSDGPSFSVT